MLRKPQAYAEFVASQVRAAGPLEAPLVVVTPYGFGVAGAEERGGQLQAVTRASARDLLAGIRISPTAKGDALAAAGTTAVRQIASAGGHPLPAHVAAAASTWTGAAGASPVVAAAGEDAPGVDLKLFAALFAAAFVVFCVALEVWHRRGRAAA